MPRCIFIPPCIAPFHPPTLPMSRTTMIASRLMLMHASLAFLSPELQTFGSIIQRPITPSNKIHLPIEILLHIRSYLLPVITHHLMQRSASALAQYESSLRDLLCSDCIAYNQFVYGPNIWQWEHFTGACECMEVIRSANRSWTLDIPDYLHVDPDPREFATAMDWLESYLSLESSCLKWRRAQSQKHSFAIWDVVEEVLRDHGCYIVRDATVTFCSGAADYVIIAVLPSLLECTNKETVMLDEDSNACWVLDKARRDLGLFLEYKGDLQVPEEVPMIWSRSHPIRSKSSSVNMSLQSHCLDILQTMAAIILAWLSLPLTFATVALTILCFFSKPRSLRIL